MRWVVQQFRESSVGYGQGVPDAARGLDPGRTPNPGSAYSPAVSKASVGAGWLALPVLLVLGEHLSDYVKDQDVGEDADADEGDCEGQRLAEGVVGEKPGLVTTSA